MSLRSVVSQCCFLSLFFFFKLTSFCSISTRKIHDHIHAHGKDIPVHITLPQERFLTIWNAPSCKCSEHFGITLNLSMFDIVVNPKQKFVGSEVTIFYEPEPGNYPRILDDGTVINGGVPQVDDLNAHLAKLKTDVQTYIPDAAFAGLGVIDWESWRPLWNRNYDSKTKYKKLSKDLIGRQHPEYNRTMVDEAARKAFDNASRVFLSSTLQAVRSLRPNGFWGYWGFPSCYNAKTPGNRCTMKTTHLNDRLRWLFDSSTALFPSIYLLTPAIERDFVVNALKEAQRFSNGKPIYPYTRFTYPKIPDQFYSKEDLLKTILTTADMGLNGVVLWEKSKRFDSKEGCMNIRDYLDNTLGPLMDTISGFFQKCSRSLCSSHGVCVRKTGGKETLDVKDYVCKCDAGWSGKDCDRR